MAAKKEQSPTGKSPRSLLGILIRGPLPGTLALVGIFVGGWWLIWQSIAPQLLHSSRYQVRLEDVEITPLPKWIHTDVRGEVFRNLTFDSPASILDDQLAQRFHDALALHPWIAKVLRVTKLPPARIKVELEYRRPVCMVQVTGGLLPVDVEGAFLPTADFSPVEADTYPVLVSVNSMPVGTPGTLWGDARVVGGAEIAATFGPAWNKLRLRQIVPSPRPVYGDQYAFELVARSGTRVIWGLPPSSDQAGGVPAAEKVARLVKYFDEHASLDGPAGPHQLDIRSANSIVIGPLTAAGPHEQTR
jgi:hypothetical protein